MIGKVLLALLAAGITTVPPAHADSPPWWICVGGEDWQVCTMLDMDNCLVPAQLRAPGVVIDDQGDVYVAGELFWDCPPYQS